MVIVSWSAMCATWRSDTDFDQVWEQKAYPLSRVTDMDLIMTRTSIRHRLTAVG